MRAKFEFSVGRKRKHHQKTLFYRKRNHGNSIKQNLYQSNCNWPSTPLHGLLQERIDEWKKHRTLQLLHLHLERTFFSTQTRQPSQLKPQYRKWTLFLPPFYTSIFVSVLGKHSLVDHPLPRLFKMIPDSQRLLFRRTRTHPVAQLKICILLHGGLGVAVPDFHREQHAIQL